MATLPDAEMILSGLIIALVEKNNFETKALEGYRATVVTSGGGAAVVNFGLDQPLPFAPLMSQVLWQVKSAPWSMKESGGSGMSTKFLAVVDETHLMGLGQILTANAERFPEKVGK